MEQFKDILLVLGSALATGFAQWVFYFRKHQAEAKGVVKNNDRQEIENLNLISKEWREAAKSWKDMADEYHAKSKENMRRIDELEQKVMNLEAALRSANRQIEKLRTQKS